MRIVARPQGAVYPHGVTLADAQWILDEGRVYLAAEVEAGHFLDGQGQDVPLLLIDAVHVSHQPGHPADHALDRDELQLGVPLEGARSDQKIVQFSISHSLNSDTEVGNVEATCQHIYRPTVCGIAERHS